MVLEPGIDLFKLGKSKRALSEFLIKKKEKFTQTLSGQ